MKKLVLLFIFLLGLLLRTYRLSDYPAGFSADEVNQGYTAYSILKTGRDEWGELLPIAPRSYGDYRAPLYTYLLVPSVAFVGLNEFAVRLPNALLGSVLVLVVYILVKEMFSGNNFVGKNVDNLALVCSFIVAVSPWHIMLSRGAFEPNLPSLIIPLAIIFFLKGLRLKKWMYLSMLTFGVGLFSYYSARYLTPIIILLLFAVYFRGKEKFIQAMSNYKFPIIVFAGFLFVAGLTMLTGGGSRSSDVAIFNPTDNWSALSDNRYEAVVLGLPDDLSRIFSNKLTYTFGEFVNGYTSYYSPQFLFTNGAGESTYGMIPGIGLLYLTEALFLGFAIYLSIKNTLYKQSSFQILIFILMISAIPAALAKGPGFAANRAAVMTPWIQIFSGIGVLGIYMMIKKGTLRILYISIVGIVLTISLLGFLQKYYFHSPIQNSRFMSYGFRDAFVYIDSRSEKVQKVLISRNFSEPQMFTAFYANIDPEITQIESADWLRYEEEGLKFVDMLGEYKLDKYVFKQINYPEDLEGSVIVVDQAKNVPDNIEVDYIVKYPDMTDAIYIINTSS